jgi:DNA-directed RNA polymerase specialized sigma24 family protein
MSMPTDSEQPSRVEKEIMRRRDQTDMGGTAETFLTTHWSLVDDVKQHRDRDQAIIGLFLERYWKPVYCYLRRKGYDNEQAKDLTQSFFHEVVLNRHLIERADPSKGCFRALLLRALDQFLVDEKRKAGARRRIPQDKLVPLHAVSPPSLPPAVLSRSPEDCFAYAWKSALIDQTLAEVEAECRAHGLQTHWQVFRERVLRPVLLNQEPRTIKDICTQYGIEGESVASNMLVTVKRRFRAGLRRNVRATVLSEGDVDGELREILVLIDKNARKK